MIWLLWWWRSHDFSFKVCGWWGWWGWWRCGGPRREKRGWDSCNNHMVCFSGDFGQFLAILKHLLGYGSSQVVKSLGFGKLAPQVSRAYRGNSSFCQYFYWMLEMNLRNIQKPHHSRTPSNPCGKRSLPALCQNVATGALQTIWNHLKVL